MNKDRFGVMKSSMGIKCSYWQCSNKRKITIGDTAQPYAVNNYHLCEEHAKQLYEALQERFGNVKTNETVEKSSNSKDKILSILLDKTGKISKADLAEIYKEETGETPTDEMTFKVLLTKMFPELEK